MKIVCWNVNGIRSALQKGFTQYIEKEDPDIICLQETKATRDQAGLLLFEYPHHFWNSGERKGYSGTAVFSRIKPLHASYGINLPHHDNEGRVITLEFKEFFLVNVYVPNSQRTLERLPYRKTWDNDFFAYVQNLEQAKPVIICGDMNVAHTELDLANPKQNVGNAGFTAEEREGFSRLLDAGFVDSFREFHKEGGRYTWWGFAFNSRERNIGWRFDYICVSDKLKSRLQNAFIRQEVAGSDHCPIGIVFKD
jgi:exodeoxyribonuclease III